MTHDIRATDLKTIEKLIEYCKQNLEDKEWELITLRLIPAAYIFRFNCEKKKVWAALNT